MKYRDRELGRLLTSADDLLANITVYETPEEEVARQQEEAAIQQEEAARQQENAAGLKAAEEEGLPEAERLLEEAAATVELEDREAAESLLEEPSGTAELEDQEELQRLTEEQTGAEESERLTEEQTGVTESETRLEDRKAMESLSERPVKEQPKADSLLSCSFFSIICFVFMEIILHLSIYRSLDTTILYPVLFSAGFGCITALISSFLPRQWNTIIFCVILIFYSLYCDLQILYHTVSGAFLSLTGMQEGIRTLIQNGDGVKQGGTTVLPWLVVMFLPLLLWAVVGRKRIRFERSNWRNRFLAAIAGIMMIAVSILCLDLHGYEADAPYVCFYHFDSETRLEPAEKQLGITAVTGLELLHLALPQ